MNRAAEISQLEAKLRERSKQLDELQRAVTAMRGDLRRLINQLAEMRDEEQ